MSDIVIGRSLLGVQSNQTHLLDYLHWPERDRHRFRAFFSRGTDPATLQAAEGMEITQIRSIGNGLLVEGFDDDARVPQDPFTTVVGSDIETDLFSGLNTLLAQRNSESPQTVKDWLHYHVTQHGAQAALIVDRAEDPQILLTSLRGIDLDLPGLKRVVVLSSPIPLGDKSLPPEAHPFCAPSAPGKDRMKVPPADPWSSPLGELLIFEIVRTRFLQDARAVAAIDVHDMLMPHDGENIFDLANSTASGVIQLEGQLSYPWRIRKNTEPSFGDHICTQFDGDKLKRRWCISPRIAGPRVVWRLVRIVGASVDPAQTRRFSSCMNLRHPVEKISQIVPKSALIENEALLAISRDVFNGNPVRVPSENVAESKSSNDRSVVVVTCMKNEGPFVLEWLAYHRAIGIKNFIVYTNDCDDGTDTLLGLLQEKGYVEHRENPFRGTDLKPQHAALNAATKEKIVKNAAWAISMDVDEFICIHVGDGTIGALFDAVPDANMISLTWRLFGNADIDEFQDTPITQNYTRCAREFANKPHQAWGFKTLFRQKGIFKKLGVHRPKGLRPQFKDDINWVNGSGALMPESAFRNAWRSTSSTYGYGLATLNHYAVRSSESFLVKRDRGRVNHVDRDQGLAYWFRMNNNEEENTSILRMAEPLKAELSSLKADPDIAAQHNACVRSHRQKIEALRKTKSFADFFEEITSERMKRLSRMHRHFGANVFLGGPHLVPDEIVFKEDDGEFFFTVERPETSH